MATTVMGPKKLGFFGWLRTSLFGSRDPVEAQLREVEHRGRALVHLAHIIAGIFIVTMSLGSLAWIGSDTLTRFIAAVGQHQFDVNDGIIAVTSLIIVIVCDMAMLMAAAKIQRSNGESLWPHWLVMIIAMIFEAATYIGMAFAYEQPKTWQSIAIVVGRGIIGPILAVYLSTYRLPVVTDHDIRYHQMRASGASVIQKTVEQANDPTMTLPEALAVYLASANLPPERAEQLRTSTKTLDEYSQRRGVYAVDARQLPQMQAQQIAEPEPDDDAGYGEESPFSGPLSNASASAFLGDYDNTNLYTSLDQLVEGAGAPPTALDRAKQAQSSGKSSPVKDDAIRALVKFWERRGVDYKNGKAPTSELMAALEDAGMTTVPTVPTIRAYAMEARNHVLAAQRDAERWHAVSSASAAHLAQS